MQYTQLGNSDLTVSRICMGCMGFGDAGRGQHSWTLDKARSRDIIKRGLELGVNFLDAVVVTGGVDYPVSYVHQIQQITKLLLR